LRRPQATVQNASDRLGHPRGQPEDGTKTKVQWLPRDQLDREAAKLIRKVDVVLDIGPGIRPQVFFRPGLHICVEPHREYTRFLQEQFDKRRDVLILRIDGLSATKILPSQAVDTVFLLDVIVHLPKGDGQRLLQECARVARQQVVVFTPLGFLEQAYEAGEIDAWGYHGGEWQIHRSGWSPEDFEDGWLVLGCREYHYVSGKGEGLRSPAGAFWAIRDCRVPPNHAALAVLSTSLPPDSSGQAVVLFRLLEKWTGGSYCLLGTHRYVRGETHSDDTDWLAGEYVFLPTTRAWNRPLRAFPGSRTFLRLRWAMSLLGSLFGRLRWLTRALRERKSRFLLACSGDPWDLPLSAVASKLLRIPLGVYLFDWYAYQWTAPSLRLLARFFEPWILRSAAVVLTHSPVLASRLSERYGIAAVNIPNPAYEVNQPKNRKRPPRSRERVFTVLFAGAIYAANEGPLRNLIGAAESMTRVPVRIAIHSAQRPEWLREAAERVDVRFGEHVRSREIHKVLSAADVLFLPLAFSSSLKEVVETAAPAKMSDYMASGNAILVHAPANSYVAQYFRRNGCGMVVDEDDPGTLAESLTELFKKPQLRRALGSAARSRAEVDFAPTIIRDAFVDAVMRYLR